MTQQKGLASENVVGWTDENLHGSTLAPLPGGIESRCESDLAYKCVRGDFILGRVINFVRSVDYGRGLPGLLVSLAAVGREL